MFFLVNIFFINFVVLIIFVFLFSISISIKSLQELRLLRNYVYAIHGFCFMESDIRSYFSGHTKWYDSIMNKRFYANENKELNSWITLTKEEKAFVDKINELEQEKLKENFKDINRRNLGNLNNIVNLFQYKDLSHDFLHMLYQNNFAIVPGENVQLFHVYEENNYKQLPNFVTTDMYLQLFHMYFTYVLRSLEMHKFIPITYELSQGIYSECYNTAKTTTDKNLKEIADYCTVFAAIPIYLLNDKKMKIPSNYVERYNEEIENINNQKDVSSNYIDENHAIKFPYSLFKPRGNYTRSEELKKYFKAMMWLQMLPFCREDTKQLEKAIFLAYVLNKVKTSSGEPIYNLYRNLYEPISFLIGQPDNLSVLDIADFMKKEGIKDAVVALNSENIAKVNKYLLSIKADKYKIKPKIVKTCPDKINLIPQRYVIDNEILENLVDVKVNANRAYPKGLDVFAGFGIPLAQDILINNYKEGEQWDKYVPTLKELQNKFKNFKDWDKSVYNKWIDCLLSLNVKNKEYPLFMQTDEWGKKNLNTSLASWAELKHDAILYAKQPMSAECGGGEDIPPPITVGYVEPNIKFWEKIIELINLTEDVLKRNNLYTDEILSRTTAIREHAEFLLSTSKKELKGEKLSDQGV